MTSSVRRVVPTVDDFTPEWFTDVMHESASGATVTSVRLEPMTTADIGWFGRLIRAHLDYDPAHAGPATVVVKLDPETEFVRDIGFRLGFFTREVGFYRDYARSVPLRVPRCHFAGIDEEAQCYAIVLEDLAAGRFADQAAGCTIDEAETLATQLAVLHAWTPPVVQSPWLPRFGDLAPTFTATYPEALDAFADHYRGRLPGAALDLGAELVDHLGAVYAAIDALPAVVLHNDCRLDNVVFELGEDERPVLYDWQSVAYGPGAVDLASLLVLSLEPADRHAGEGRILERYRRELERHGLEVDAGELARGYALAVVHQFALGVSAFPSSPPDRPAFVAWARRASEALTEIEIDELL